MAQDNSDAEQLRRTVDKALGGVVDRRPRREPVAAESPASPPTFEQRVADAVRNAPEYVEAIRQARDAVGAASRSAAEIDLIPETLRPDQPLGGPNDLTAMLADHGPEGDQRLDEATVDWNDRLTRGQESLAQATTHLDAAATALATASGHRLAAETPGLLPMSGSQPEHDLATMTNDIKAAQERAGVLRERLESDLGTLKYDVLGHAGNPPSGWRSGIRDAAASIRWTGSVHAGIATQLGSVSSQLDGLASKLERYSPKSVSSESAHSAGPSSEHDLRRRTAVKPAGRGAQAGK